MNNLARVCGIAIPSIRAAPSALPERLPENQDMPNQPKFWVPVQTLLPVVHHFAWDYWASVAIRSELQ
jgi:hypothetical protein